MCVHAYGHHIITHITYTEDTVNHKLSIYTYVLIKKKKKSIYTYVCIRGGEKELSKTPLELRGLKTIPVHPFF